MYISLALCYSLHVVLLKSIRGWFIQTHIYQDAIVICPLNLNNLKHMYTLNLTMMDAVFDELYQGFRW